MLAIHEDESDNQNIVPYKVANDSITGRKTDF